MRQIITTLLCAIVLIATASFKPTSLKDIKKLNGKLQKLSLSLFSQTNNTILEQAQYLMEI